MGEERAEGTEVIFLSGVDTVCVGDLRQLHYSTVTALLIAPLPFPTPSVCWCVSELYLKRMITSLLPCGYDLQEISVNG